MPPSRNLTNSVLTGYETSGGVPDPRYSAILIDNRTFYYGKEGHYGYPDFPPNKNVGSGMRLDGVVTTKQLIPVGRIWRGGPNTMYYDGSLCVEVVHTGAWRGTFLPDAWGTEAYQRMKPTKPEWSIGQSIAELRELPGALRERFLNAGLNTVGKAAIGYQFGWKPLLQDIVNLYYSQQLLEKRIKQLLRDNGKPVRRRCTLVDRTDVVSDELQTAYGAFSPLFVTQYYRKIPTIRKIQTDHEKVWASACFKYWLAGGPQDVNWNRALKARLMGLYPSPSEIYRAIPWTWLIDWFFHIGDMLENMEVGVANRLAASYYYIMREKEWRVAQTATGYFIRQDGSNVDVTGTSYSRATTKSRAVGDPFGFNTPPASLTSMQWAILGSLGMSKVSF